LPVVGRPRHPVIGVMALFAVGATALAVTHGQYRLAIVTSIIGAVVCLSIVVLTGYLGLLSLAQMAFAGIAGFALSRLQHQLGVPFPIDVLTAAVLAAVAGLVIGLPALRVRGPALAVATLTGAVAVQALLFEDPRLTGGLAGSTVHAPSIAGLSLSPGAGGSGYPRLAFGLLALVVLTAIAAGLCWLRGSSLGRRLLAVRANERAAEAVGVSLTTTKLVGFSVSAFVAGLAGVLSGWQQGQLSFGSFDVFTSLAFVAVAYVGGVGRVSGAVIGGLLVGSGLVFTALDDLAGLGRYQVLASAVAVIVVTVLAPDGLAGATSRLARRWRP
jgi:branched-chain amino acid transport system permease protein